MSDINGAGDSCGPTSNCGPVPPAVLYVLIPLILLSLAVSILILVVVHSAFLLGFLLLVSGFVIAFLLWNIHCFKTSKAVQLFIDRFPETDLVSARHGQIVKITGMVSCGDLAYESSYEKVERCVYTSTRLYEYGRSILKPRHQQNRCFMWNLAYAERYTADFYLTDTRSGLRLLVKAGDRSKLIPLIQETELIKTTRKDRQLSSTLKKWLRARNLPFDGRLLLLVEGSIKEGSSLTVIGMLRRSNNVLMIVPPDEPVGAGCYVKKFLLPIDIDGLVISSTKSHLDMIRKF